MIEPYTLAFCLVFAAVAIALLFAPLAKDGERFWRAENALDPKAEALPPLAATSGWHALALSAAVLLGIALAEELAFRWAYLRLFPVNAITAAANPALFAAYHLLKAPFYARSGDDRKAELFRDPAFLCLCAMAGATFLWACGEPTPAGLARCTALHFAVAFVWHAFGGGIRRTCGRQQQIK